MNLKRSNCASNTPCRYSSNDAIALRWLKYMGVMLIHPFREGNGRLGRLLATLMALQAGLPQLEFSDMIVFGEGVFLLLYAPFRPELQPMKKILVTDREVFVALE